MKKTMMTMALFAVFAGCVFAADKSAPLLCDLPCPTPVPAAVCEPPPPPVAVAPQACEPAPPAPCPAPAPAAVCTTPAVAVAPMAPEPTVTEFKVVTKKRRVYEEEEYVVNEKQTVVMNEMRTRPGKLKSPRLYRPVTANGAEIHVYKQKPYTESYLHPVKTTYSVPVTKTRKVAKTVEDHEIVPVKKRIRR